MTEPAESPSVPYFGPEFMRKDYEVQIETPVGDLCLDCEEPIEEGDVGTLMNCAERAPTGAFVIFRRPIHYECSMRQIIGSVGHLMGTCSCCGGSEMDPPGMTRREAAKEALRIWQARQARKYGG